MDNVDHMLISVISPSSVILIQTKYGKKNEI